MRSAPRGRTGGYRERVPDDRAPAPHPGELPAPYEVEAPVDDVALVPVGLGLAALLVTALSVLLPALGAAGALVGLLGLAASALVARRRTPVPRTAVAGAVLSATALLLSAVLVAVAVLAALGTALEYS